MQTPATKLLDSLNIHWVGHEYHHDPAARDFGAEAARELQVEPSRVFKTLVVRIDTQEYAVAVLPVDSMLDLKELARSCSGKRGEMATIADAERVTGYVHGGISPLGQRKILPTALDQSASLFDSIFVSGGRRGFDIELAPADLLRACTAQYANLRRGG